MDDMAQGVLNRVALSINVNQGLSKVGDWLCKYTRLDGRPFSFKDHEMQIQICNDTNSRKVVQKCSQVGMSEIAARITAAIAAMTKGKHIIYVLPTRTFATKFSSSRFSPIIHESPMLMSMSDKAVKSTELRKIGTSFIYFGGTSGNVNGAISVPASYLILDEYDFQTISVSRKFHSRLKHAATDEHHRKGSITTFSTPTLPEYGVNEEFLTSDQKHYNVICQNCEHDFAPDYFENIKIPDYDGNMIDLTPRDIQTNQVRTADAYMECPNCKADVWPALCDVNRRHWVPKNPGSIVSGYQIHPWDVPKINSIPSILMQIPGFGTSADYYNFAVGIPWVDKDNSFLLERLEEGEPAPWFTKGGQGTFYMGVDIGKTSNIVIGRVMQNGTEEINYMERYTISGTGVPIHKRITELCKLFNVRCCVIDAAPDFTTALEAIKNNPLGKVYACEYKKGRLNGLDMISVPEKPELAEDFVVKAFRTGSMQELMRAHNSGLISYPRPDSTNHCASEVDELRVNLKNTKKLRIINAEGDTEERFIATGADHYVHAINYFRIAFKISSVTSSSGFSVKPSVSKFKSKKKLHTNLNSVF